MTRTILALIAIFLCTTAAWTILGTTIHARTYSADSRLGTRVESSWGREQTQAPPVATTPRIVKRVVEETSGGTTVTKSINEIVLDVLPPEQSRVRAAIDLEQRKKGGDAT